ncbi:MAG: acetyl-CoA carboxylase biotin carboxyl carrier protein subunit [Chloroflexi bacterium]|nr:acetyl-CoA carboxylase biotin carboxyl carrier protein subunit [Chloroflexota bacterium]
MKFAYRVDGRDLTLTLEKTPSGYRARLGDAVHEVEFIGVEGDQIHFRLDGESVRARAAAGPGDRWVALGGRTWRIEKAQAARRAHDAGAGGGQVAAPMPGQVRAVLVAEGDEVTQGQPLLLMEAMKMEIRIAAPRAGRIAALRAAEGATVNKDDILVEIT